MKRLVVSKVALLILMVALNTFCLAGCREAAAQLPTVPLPASMKGYELYSWRLGKAWRFTLVTGSNRLKTIAEATSRESRIEGEWVKITVEGVTDLKAVLDMLPSGATVSWAAPDLPSGFVMPWVRLGLPPEPTIEAVRVHCDQQETYLEIVRQGHGKGTSLPELALDRNRAPLCLDQGLGDRQAQAKAGRGAGSITSIEAVKDALA